MTIYISHLFEDKDFSKIMLENQKIYFASNIEPNIEPNIKIGIETIDFAAGDYLDKKEEQISSYQNRIGDLLENYQLSIHGPFLDLCPHSFDRYIREATKLRYEETYQMAKKMKAKHIIFHSCLIPSIYYSSIWEENSIPFWKDFLKDKDDSIAIHLENVFDEDYHSIKNVIQKVNHPGFTMCLDVGHVNCFSKQPVEEWLEEMKAVIGHIHLHNNDGKKDLHWQLDKGTINMETLIPLIQEKCPKADWTLEMNRGVEVEASLLFLKKQLIC